MAHESSIDLTCLGYSLLIVTRIMHICLLLAALTGLLGQSVAWAMAPALISSGPLQATGASVGCNEMANLPAPGKSPCKKMTLQCIAAMGCAPAALIEPVAQNIPFLLVDRLKAALPLAGRLWGRTYGPEPDPPSFLI